MYYQSKPLYIIGTIKEQIVPVLVVIKVLKVLFVDLIAVIRCRARISNYLDLIYLFLLICICFNLFPLKQIETKISGGTAGKTDILNAAGYTSRILIFNICMLCQSCALYVTLQREYGQNVDDTKVKKGKKD